MFHFSKYNSLISFYSPVRQSEYSDFDEFQSLYQVTNITIDHFIYFKNPFEDQNLLSQPKQEFIQNPQIFQTVEFPLNPQSVDDYFIQKNINLQSDCSTPQNLITQGDIQEQVEINDGQNRIGELKKRIKKMEKVKLQILSLLEIFNYHPVKSGKVKEVYRIYKHLKRKYKR